MGQAVPHPAIAATILKMQQAMRLTDGVVDICAIPGDVVTLQVVPLLTSRENLSLKQVFDQSRSDRTKGLRQALDQQINHAPIAFVKRVLEMLRSHRGRDDNLHYLVEYAGATHNSEGKPITDRTHNLERLLARLFSLTPLNLFRLAHLLKSEYGDVVNEHVLWACFELTYHQKHPDESLDEFARFLAAKNAGNYSGNASSVICQISALFDTEAETLPHEHPRLGSLLPGAFSPFMVKKAAIYMGGAFMRGAFCPNPSTYECEIVLSIEHRLIIGVKVRRNKTNKPSMTRALDFYRQELKPTLAANEMVIALFGGPSQTEHEYDYLFDETVLSPVHGGLQGYLVDVLWAETRFLRQVFRYLRAHSSINWHARNSGLDEYANYVKALAYFFNQGWFNKHQQTIFESRLVR